MSILVYWLEATPPEAYFPSKRTSKCEEFGANELTLALKFCQEQRNAGHSHVCMSSENSDSVGKPGVDTVADGKTPDGHPYEWSKQGRAGKMRR